MKTFRAEPREKQRHNTPVELLENFNSRIYLFFKIKESRHTTHSGAWENVTHFNLQLLVAISEKDEREKRKKKKELPQRKEKGLKEGIQ